MAFSTNLHNSGHATGRLTANPVTFGNRDGSVKVKFTLAVDNNYKSADGTYGTQFLSFETLVAAKANGNLGPYAKLEEGDKISVGYALQSNNYTNGTGEKVYEQIAFVYTVQFEETPNEKAARKARKETNAAVANAAANNPAVAPEFDIPL